MYADRNSTPPVQPQSKTPQQPPTEDSPPSPASSPLHTRPHDDPDINAEIVDDELPEEFLLALGTEGQEQAEVGNPIRPELASRWTKIMNDGLGKEAREAIVKKYPPPANFSAAIAPIINSEIASTLSDPSVKRDKRIMIRQGLTDCADKIRAAQTIQKTSNTIKNHPEKEKKQQKQTVQAVKLEEPTTIQSAESSDAWWATIPSTPEALQPASPERETQLPQAEVQISPIEPEVHAEMSIPYIVTLPWLPGYYRRGVQ
ncbi:uncharacterized protein LOC125229867 [Leguminivora glycinivorella]|uniref:uncharacterized protein LOC125229867 n=1 Tax=Leguminivora glycinivorella TaxID=1035111 RepID=UPI00200F04A2|nr:uncharacterized protein LOC125229867 [Leguminivora glycinivorella]